MTQEDKELLLKDLGARLSYKVVAQVSYKDGEGWKTEDRKILGVYTDGQVYADCVYTNIENIKPYLRPLSSMTDEELHEVQEILGKGVEDYIEICGCKYPYSDIDVLNQLKEDYLKGLGEYE